MPNKLTDAEIKKALEDKIEFKNFDENEYAVIDIEKLKNALDLINRLQATIDSFTDIGKLYSEIKAEAYKEFADKLCEGRVSNDNTVILAKCLLKELVGDNDAR